MPYGTGFITLFSIFDYLQQNSPCYLYIIPVYYTYIGMIDMEINKIVCIQTSKEQQWCRYYRDWHKIPVFLTSDGKDSRSALYKDGTSFLIISGKLSKTPNEEFMLNRLWHEVAHLFFQDVWKPWDIRFEYRADLVSAAATSRNLTLSRLNAIKKTVSDRQVLTFLESRLENLYRTPNTYTKEAAIYMLSSLKPVTVLK